MSSAVAAAPEAATALQPQRHTWLQSLAYHLLPGVAPVACMLALAPAVQAKGLPAAMALYLGAFFGVLPVQLGILLYQGWRRNGRFSLKGIVLLRERVPAGKLLLIFLGLFAWATIVFGLLKGWLDGLLLPAFQWLPDLLRPLDGDMSAFSTGTALTTWAVGFVGTALLAPFVEELYFRGFLLPRIPASSRAAPLVHAVLFSLYHFWSPWQNLTRIAQVAPMVFAVQKTRSIRVSVLPHLVLNSAAMLTELAILLG